MEPHNPILWILETETDSMDTMVHEISKLEYEAYTFNIMRFLIYNVFAYAKVSFQIGEVESE
jgi:hypothetical protein